MAMSVIEALKGLCKPYFQEITKKQENKGERVIKNVVKVSQSDSMSYSNQKSDNSMYLQIYEPILKV